MKQFEVAVSRVLLSLAVILLVPSTASAAALCQPFTYQDWFGSVPMTAAVVNPTSPVTGEIDATGCDVGVFFGIAGSKGLVQNAKIHGARHAGVLVGGAGIGLTVDVLSSSIYDIGAPVFPTVEILFSGAAVAFAGEIVKSSGKISGNVLSRYGMVGIYATSADLQIADNIISGQRSGWFSANIGQVGIYSPWGAKLTIERNTIVDHVYTGEQEWWSAMGICARPEPGSRIRQNTLVNNLVGIFLGMEEMPGPTSITVVDNRITADDVYSPVKWQVGLYLVGTRDRIEGNVITGYGYDVTTKPGWTFPTYVSETDPRGKPK